MVTKSHRRLGRTIRILESSVEISQKESQAKEAEKKYREKAQKLLGSDEDSPVQSLRNSPMHRKDSE